MGFRVKNKTLSPKPKTLKPSSPKMPKWFCPCARSWRPGIQNILWPGSPRTSSKDFRFRVSVFMALTALGFYGLGSRALGLIRAYKSPCHTPGLQEKPVIYVSLCCRKVNSSGRLATTTLRHGTSIDVLGDLAHPGTNAISKTRGLGIVCNYRL